MLEQAPTLVQFWHVLAPVDPQHGNNYLAVVKLTSLQPFNKNEFMFCVKHVWY